MDYAPEPRCAGAGQAVAGVPAPTDAADPSGGCEAVACSASGASWGWEGRVEHVVAGQAMHIHTLEELQASGKPKPFSEVP